MNFKYYLIVDHAFFFSHTDTPVHYQVEGSRQAIRVTMFLDNCHFSELPTRLKNGGSLKLQSVLFTRGGSRQKEQDKILFSF